MHIYTVSFFVKIVAIYALLVCKIFGPKIRSCKFFDKSQVCRDIACMMTSECSGFGISHLNLVQMYKFQEMCRFGRPHQTRYHVYESGQMYVEILHNYSTYDHLCCYTYSFYSSEHEGKKKSMYIFFLQFSMYTFSSVFPDQQFNAVSQSVGFKVIL